MRWLETSKLQFKDLVEQSLGALIIPGTRHQAPPEKLMLDNFAFPV